MRHVNMQQKAEIKSGIAVKRTKGSKVSMEEGGIVVEMSLEQLEECNDVISIETAVYQRLRTISPAG
jgi:hypothetical protein